MEREIAQMEEDMRSHYSETVSVKSRAQEIMDQVMAEEEEKMSAAMSRSRAGGSDKDEDEEEEEDSDDEKNNVFYKASDLIVSYNIMPLCFDSKHLSLFFVALTEVD